MIDVAIIPLERMYDLPAVVDKIKLAIETNPSVRGFVSGISACKIFPNSKNRGIEFTTIHANLRPYHRPYNADVFDLRRFAMEDEFGYLNAYYHRDIHKTKYNNFINFYENNGLFIPVDMELFTSSAGISIGSIGRLESEVFELLEIARIKDSHYFGTFVLLKDLMSKMLYNDSFLFLG